MLFDRRSLLIIIIKRKPCCLSVTGFDIIQAPRPRVVTFSELAESYSGSALTSNIECCKHGQLNQLEPL